MCSPSVARAEKFSDMDALPVWMRCWQHELEVDSTCSILQLVMLDAVQLVGDISSAHIHLKGKTGHYY